MQRNGKDGIRTDDLRRCRADHPSGHHGRQINPIAILEIMHQVPRHTLVQRNRPEPIEDRWMGDGLRRHHAVAGIMRKRQAEHRAIGFFDQPHLSPADGAERVMACDTGMTMGTSRRIDEMKQPAQNRSGMMPADGCAFLH